VGDSVDARELDDQRSTLDPPVDPTLRQASTPQLTPRDHTMRPARDPRDLLVIRPVLPTHTVGKAG
jgi:hypothetical protein